MSFTTQLRNILALVLGCLAFGSSTLMGQFHNGLDMAFGQQRVQYRTFDWQYLSGDPFELHFYQGGRDLAEYGMNALVMDLPDVESTFQRRLSGPVEVLIFNKHAEFRQSNIGIDGSAASNIGGSTLIYGKKLFAWYDGDHAAFRLQLRKGLHRILLRQYIFGDDWKDVVKNSQLFQLPPWMEEGMVAALSGPISGADQAKLEDLTRRALIPQLQVLNGEERRIAAEAVWRFVLETFGRQSALEVLSGFKAGRTVDAGFRRIGMDLEGLLSAAQAHHSVGQAIGWDSNLENGVLAETTTSQIRPAHMGALPHRGRRKYAHRNFSSSADGRWTAWVTDERGQVRVWWSDGERKRCIAKVDHKLTRIADDTYPVLAWHPSLPVLAHIHEEKGRVFLTISDAASGESNEKELFRIEKVIDLDWSPDGRRIAFSGVRAGKTDLYVYNTLAGSQVPLWEDGWDDLNPDWMPDGRSLLFSSNRPGEDDPNTNPAVPVNRPRDLWLYDLDAQTMERITDTPEEDEVRPLALDAATMAYQIAGQPSIMHMAKRDSAILRVDTAIHYRYFTRKAPWFHTGAQVAELKLLESRDGWEAVVIERGRPRWKSGDLPPPPMKAAMSEVGAEAVPSAQKPWDYLPEDNLTLLPGQVDYRNYTFESERALGNPDSDRNSASTAGPSTEPVAELPPISTPLPYRRNYALDQLG